MVLYRAVYEAYEADPVPSRSQTGGRYHHPAEPTSYMGSTPETAWLEVKAHWPAEPAAYRMVKLEISDLETLDLTDSSVQTTLGITEEELIGFDYSPTRRVAARARAEGVEGLRTYSASDRPDGRQIVTVSRPPAPRLFHSRDQCVVDCLVRTFVALCSNASLPERSERDRMEHSSRPRCA